jgi:hypothetical protein
VKYDWSNDILAAERALGIKQFEFIASSGNAQWILDDCKNTNLDEDGFCQFCDRHHFKVAFGKQYKSGAARSDQGCMTFGDDAADNDWMPGNNIMFSGTPSVGLAVDLE